jgi:hypothetical protein
MGTCPSQIFHSLKKGGCPKPPKRFRRKVKASKCVQNLKNRIKNSAQSFEGSRFYPIAELSFAEPFLKFRRAKKGSVEKIQSPDGFGLNSKGSVSFRRNFSCSAEL